MQLQLEFRKDDFLLGMSYPLVAFILVMILSIVTPNAYILAVFGLSYWLIFISAFFLRCKLNKEFYRQPEIVLLLLFCVYALLSLFWSPWENNEDLLLKELVRILSTIGVIMLFGFVSSDKKLTQLDLYFLVTMSLCGVYLIFLGASRTPYFLWGATRIIGDGFFRFSPPIGWLYAMSLLLMIDKLSCWTKGYKYLLVLSCIIYVAVIFLVQSRGAYLGFFAGLLCFAFLKGGQIGRFIAIGGVFAVFLYFFIYYFFDFYFIERLIDRGSSGRLYIYQQAVEVLRQKLIFGHGFAALSEVSSGSRIVGHYHSLYLNIFFYGGSVGLLLFLIMTLVFFFSNRKNMVGIGWYSVVLMFLVVSIFDVQHILTYPLPELFLFVVPISVVVSLRLQAQKMEVV